MLDCVVKCTSHAHRRTHARCWHRTERTLHEFMQSVLFPRRPATIAIIAAWPFLILRNLMILQSRDLFPVYWLKLELRVDTASTIPITSLQSYL